MKGRCKCTIFIGDNLNFTTLIFFTSKSGTDTEKMNKIVP